MVRWLVALVPMLALAACAEEACDAGEFECSADEVLQECVDGAWTDVEACGDQGLMCHADMGHCM